MFLDSLYIESLIRVRDLEYMGVYEKEWVYGCEQICTEVEKYVYSKFAGFHPYVLSSLVKCKGYELRFSLLFTYFCILRMYEWMR